LTDGCCLTQEPVAAEPVENVQGDAAQDLTPGEPTEPTEPTE
jgi:hypothetical protein